MSRDRFSVRGYARRFLGIAALSAAGFTLAPGAHAAEPFFMKQTGGYFHYVRENDTKFSTIREQIEAGYYAARGVRNIIFYCPYKATEDFRGVPALDYFATNPNTGSVDDFRAMAAAAHSRGMAVMAYMGLLFVDEGNAIWIKAQKDYKAGTKSPEANSFRFADDDNGQEPNYGGWEFSDVAGAYYATSWGRPALDLGTADGRAYVKSVLKFWIELGVDGFEYDAIEGFWGQMAGVMKEVLVTYPNSSGQKYLIREGSFASYENADDSDAIGLTHVLLSGDTDDSSVATDVVDGSMSVDELEAHFAKYLDARRAVGRGAKAVSNYSDMSAGERAFEAAVLAGNGAVMEIDYNLVYEDLEPAQQQQYDAVFVALARSAAEAPGASRKRVPSGGNDATYAVVRQSVDGASRALNLYNFSRQSVTIEVDLAGTGIEPGDVPTNLVTNEPAAAVTSGEYQVQLPSLGYALLGFGPLNTGTGGTDSSSGGAPASGGTDTSPPDGQGGTGGSKAGSSSAGGSTSSGGTVTSSNGGESDATPEPGASSGDSGGCGCVMMPRSGRVPAGLAIVLLLGVLARRRRSARV
jgi:Alpha amylase, catalytic domain